MSNILPEIKTRVIKSKMLKNEQVTIQPMPVDDIDDILSLSYNVLEQDEMWSMWNYLFRLDRTNA